MQNTFAAVGLAAPADPVPPTVDGLTERDYIPLIIAIFVDLCILLVSINRPFGPFFELSRSMEAARRGTMNEYLETFYKVFQDQFDPARRPTAAQVIAPIQDVVFDHKGQYYAAVPLDFREEDYLDWLAKRTGPKAAEAIFQATSQRPLEVSRYITSVFATLEGNDFVRLIEAKDDGLDAALIKQKLDQQGSVYAQADAFRVYRFREKAWARILMQSVGSSAAMSEEVARRKTKEGTWERAPVQIPAQEGVYKGQAFAEDAPSKRVLRRMSASVRRWRITPKASMPISIRTITAMFGSTGTRQSANGEPGTGGSQARNSAADADTDTPQLGILTRFRNFLFRK